MSRNLHATNLVHRDSTLFMRFSRLASHVAGHPYTFLAAVCVVLGWAMAGPVFNYSNTWQLFINTGTTIITFLMVFLIQNSTNRDAEAMHLKLDEIIRALPTANPQLLDLEELSETDVAALKKQYFKKAADARRKGIRRGVN